MDINRLESYIFKSMAATHLPALSIAVVKENEIVYSQGFGQRDLKDGLPATEDTLYGIGSVTKSFTAIAIMQLVERDFFKLDDPVSNFLPFYIKPEGQEVTVRHLLNHTVGLPALAYSEALIRHAHNIGGTFLPIADPEDILTFMKGSDDWVESAPGEKWHYFNEGYAMLGLIVQQLTGIPFNEYIRQEILSPLSMASSFFEKSNFKDHDDIAVPYVINNKGAAKPGRYLYRMIRSEGGMISNVVDLSRYVRFLMGTLRGDSAILSEKSLMEIMSPTIAEPFLTTPELFDDSPKDAVAEPATHYGYGMEIEEDFFGNRLIGHGGSVMVSTANISFVPDQSVGVAILANGSGYSLKQIAKFALALVMDEEPTQLPYLRIEDSLQGLTGRYETYKSTVQAEIRKHDDFLKLLIDDKAQPEEIILVPDKVNGNTPSFYTLKGGRRLNVDFRYTEDGIELMYQRYKFKRVGI